MCKNSPVIIPWFFTLPLSTFIVCQISCTKVNYYHLGNFTARPFKCFISRTRLWIIDVFGDQSRSTYLKHKLRPIYSAKFDRDLIVLSKNCKVIRMLVTVIPFCIAVRGPACAAVRNTAFVYLSFRLNRVHRSIVRLIKHDYLKQILRL